MRHVRPLATARKWLAAVALAAVAAAPFAAARAPVQDLSDLWWNPGQPGWGVAATQQGSTLFLVFYVQDAKGAPTWLTAMLKPQGDPPAGAPSVTYTGAVYETLGSWWVAPFDPAQTSSRQVGTATFVADGDGSATLAYSVDGVDVARTVQRQDILIAAQQQTSPRAGSDGGFAGSLVFTSSNCTSPAQEGSRVAYDGTFDFWGDDGDMVLEFQSPGMSCHLQGPYTLTGKTGRGGGPMVCQGGGFAGIVGLRDIRGTSAGTFATVFGRVTRDGVACDISGALGGARQ